MVFIGDGFENINEVKTFSLRSPSNKAKTMLKWLFHNDNFLEDIILSKKFINVGDINNIGVILDSFMDEDVDIDILKNFMKKEAFVNFKHCVEMKKNANTFVCGKCSRTVQDSIRCDSCLLWFHYSCAMVKYSPNISKESWYCSNC